MAKSSSKNHCYQYTLLLILAALIVSSPAIIIPRITENVNAEQENDMFSAEAPKHITELQKITKTVEETPSKTEPQANPGSTTQTATQQSPVPKPTISVTVEPQPNFVAQIIIGSIGLSAGVEEVGVTTNRQIDVPLRSVGWYNGSAKLGATSGTSFFDGHSDGIFSGLTRAEIGHTIQIVNGNTAKTYRIEAKTTKNLAGLSMGPILDYYKYPNRGIALMTCAGSYSSAAGTYDQRLIVYAKLI